MTDSLVVLRTSALVMLLLVLITGLYARHVARISADAAAQSAVGAAAREAIAAGWQCLPDPPPAAVAAATRAAWGQIRHLAVQPIAVELDADACNLIAAVTAAPLDVRVSALQATAVACQSAADSATVSVPGSC